MESKSDLAQKYHRPDLEIEDMKISEKQIQIDLKKIINEKSLIIDIGANVGQFAEDLVNIGPVKKIYSFEPVEGAFIELAKLAEKIKQIIPIRKAVSLENGDADFYITESDVGSSLLAPLDGQTSKWLTLDRQVIVETIRLDTFIEENIQPEERMITLLKSDAQGADLDVILSAGSYLNPKSIKSILIEINFSEFYKKQQNYYHIFETLDKAGYRMARFYSHRAHDEWLWWADVLFIEK